MLNYFEKRATNAASESFNARIKAFRAQFRGVRQTEFFIYRPEFDINFSIYIFEN